MYFKLTILLLYFIITTNSVLEKPEDENKDPVSDEIEDALKDAYEYVLVQFNVSPGKVLSSTEMTTFLGSNNLEVKHYLMGMKYSPETQEKIDLKLFKELVRLVCNRYKYDVTDFLNLRKEVIA